jgi:hypothetical protein
MGTMSSFAPSGGARILPYLTDKMVSVRLRVLGQKSSGQHRPCPKFLVNTAHVLNLFSVRRGWDTYESMFTHFRRRRAAFTPLRNRSLGPPCISEFEGLMQIP